MLDFIIWNVAPEIFTIGKFALRWYGLLFALGFIIGQQIIFKVYRLEGKDPLLVERLTIWMVLATVIGARLGHCLFYEPEIYLKNPIEILKIWEGGLASHGAAVAIILAIWLYARKYPDQSMLWLLDRIVIVVALSGCFIRMGNLMNSEIIGKPTDAPTGFVFARSANDRIDDFFSQQNYKGLEKITFAKTGIDTTINNQLVEKLNLLIELKDNTDPLLVRQLQGYSLATLFEGPEEEGHDHIVTTAQSVTTLSQTKAGYIILSTPVFGIPRHPSQLYESLSCILLFAGLYFLYMKQKGKTPEGSLLGIFMVVCFGLRFVYEYLKENQVAFESNLSFNMGQILSIPLILAGIGLIVFAYSKKNKNLA